MTSTNPAAATAQQGALFGEPVSIPTDDQPGSQATAQAATQDVELVASVVRLAQDPGYRLIEHSGRVLRVDPATDGAGAVEDVPRHEADAVTQLLDSGLLDLGGNHTVTYRGQTGPSRSVLVPKRTRDMATRWSHLRPLTTPAGPAVQDKHTDQTGKGGRPTSGRIVVDVIRPGRGLLTCAEFCGELIRENGRYLVETEGGHVVGRASSYRAGAQMLARHHGYQPGPIAIDRREEHDGNAPPPRPSERDQQLGRGV